MALYDYTVVGASSAGVAVARRLANAGMEVNNQSPFM
jgi:choline dehydrogenase-like flavoprotein